jgi:thioester reductase-like protein
MGRLLRMACMNERKAVAFYYVSTIGVLSAAGPMARTLREDDPVPDLFLDKVTHMTHAAPTQRTHSPHATRWAGGRLRAVEVGE